MAVMATNPDKNQPKREAQAVRLDGKGRISVPLGTRKSWNLQAGDILFVKDHGDWLEIRKGINPFDILVEHALQEYREGKTMDLDAVARELGIDLDE
ncbi:MAG TPA: AbrB/MazE/SpoVT family DNA-binding domain-containing protein [Firmicutes bacterium]|jgi:bifunctional DNA-binding transcriptional regulator/antitoxin component of YhaV-PrlF toxin-antitoxin module|nr:AbrB/MazE/SpoVT family DNA-binding domain-containing protein [Bacillota bacterium]